jgi:GT2 family glycosyltransferase
MDIPAGDLAPPGISIVIATYDRPVALERCLDALLLQKASHSVEIIVVDNHPQSGMTAPLSRRYTNIIWLQETVAGLSRARNCGISSAKGTVIVTTDDDVIPTQEWLERLTAPLFEPNGPAATTGNCLPLKTTTQAEQLFEAYGGLQHGPSPACFDAHWMAQWHVTFPQLWRIGTTANAAFRASALKDPRVGPFEERLGAGTPAGAWEDLYCYYRMLRAGYRVCYLPDAVLLHAHRERMDQLERQLFAYRRGETAFLSLVSQRHHDARVYGQMFLWIPQWRLRMLLAELLRRLRGKRLFPMRLLWNESAQYFKGPAALRNTP